LRIVNPKGQKKYKKTSKKISKNNQQQYKKKRQQNVNLQFEPMLSFSKPANNNTELFCAHIHCIL